MHDIGKNIVAVVLQCNNYDVVNLGVMVPARTILETAKRENADAIGLSGLITPSLEEMAHVAREMEREGFTRAAADRRRHHLARAHRGEDRAELSRARWCTCPDASRSVGVMQSLLSPEQRDAYVAGVRADYEKIRVQHRDKKGPGPLLPIAEARRLGLATDWSAYRPPAPRTPGITVLRDYPLDKLVPYIDWTPFFQAWELSGPYPKILEDPVVGEAARKLHAEALETLEQHRAREVGHARTACSASFRRRGSTATTSKSTAMRPGARWP